MITLKKIRELIGLTVMVRRLLLFLNAMRGRRVECGPFKGMRYISEAHGSALVPKLYGTYEQEVSEAIERIIAWCPNVAVNVGCAEGYYAVGLAMRMPDLKSLGLDLNSACERSVHTLAQINNLSDRVEFAHCNNVTDTRLLIARAAETYRRAAVICDCEGAERDILDIDILPCLTECLIFVETHEHDVPGVEPLLISRFEHTHYITRFAAVPRTGREAAARIGLTFTNAFRRQLQGCLDEMRIGPAQTWLLLLPKSVSA